MRSDVPNLVLREHPLHEPEAAIQDKHPASTVPVVISSAQWMKSAGLATKRGRYLRLTGKEDIDDVFRSIKGAIDNHGLEQQMELLRKLLGERASLYELVGNWRQIKKLVSVFV
ncbi:MAG: hypothetical protein SWQ30_01980 [Thermodesulfobacteriota bacterium]|nr:hypothetical protein [Thermodesulfobacteriota bacterium]